MEYKYGKKDNYQNFSSGRVLYHEGGMTNFPVRLAQEIYGRCLQYSPKKTIFVYMIVVVVGDIYLLFWDS